MDGFIIVNKNQGITSHDVCDKIKYILHTKKVGHTGTLDPLATGVVVVAVGKATKLIQYLENQKKTYVAKAVFGYDTDTFDILGQKTKENPNVLVLEEEVDKALEILAKRTTQIPPIYSAIKVNGKKLYDYALQNQEVEIKPRPIKIDTLKRISPITKAEDGYYYTDILIEANKGFYVRSLIHDLGELTNYYASMAALKRMKAGNYPIEISQTIEEIRNNGPRLFTIEETFSTLDRVEVSPYIATKVKNGLVLDERQYQKNEMFFVCLNGKIIALYTPALDGSYKPVIYLGDSDGNI